MTLLGGVVPGIGARGPWETATRPAVGNRPDARAGGLVLLMSELAAAIASKLEDTAWQKAHEELVRLATERAGLDFEEGRGLLRAHRSGAHPHLGYASFYEYTERLFGYGPRLSQEKLRVAEALEDVPETARDLQTGAICFSLARELTRPSTRAVPLRTLAGATAAPTPAGNPLLQPS